MTLFTLPFTHPVEFFVALLIGGSFVALFQRSAMSSERRETSWVRRYVTGPNGKVTARFCGPKAVEKPANGYQEVLAGRAQVTITSNIEAGTLAKTYVLRRILTPMGTVDAIEFLLDKLRQTKGNSDFFDSMNA